MVGVLSCDGCCSDRDLLSGVLTESGLTNFRGVYGTRQVLFMNRDDMARLAYVEGQNVDVTTAVDDGHLR
ncbi:MAG: hypothetical protein EOO24_53785, partial [Comamonadaceae bacterium]